MLSGYYDLQNIYDQMQFFVVPNRQAVHQVDPWGSIVCPNHVVFVGHAKLIRHFECDRNRPGPVVLFAFHSLAGDQLQGVLHH